MNGRGGMTDRVRRRYAYGGQQAGLEVGGDDDRPWRSGGERRAARAREAESGSRAAAGGEIARPGVERDLTPGAPPERDADRRLGRAHVRRGEREVERGCGRRDGRRAPAARAYTAERPRLARRQRGVPHVQAERRGEGAGAVRRAVGVAPGLAVATARGPPAACPFGTRDPPFDEAIAITCPRRRRGEKHHHGVLRADPARGRPP